MAQFPKKSLPAPPQPSDTIAMLAEPEIAPSPIAQPKRAKNLSRRTAHRRAKPAPQVAKMDGRSLRATGRSFQISTRITEEHKLLIYNLAKKHNLMIAEILELGAEALRDKLDSQKP